MRPLTWVVGAVVSALLIRRLRQAWRQQLLLADLLVGLGDSTDRTMHRALPEAVVSDLAKVFASVFVHNPMYRYLISGGNDAWREKMLRELFGLNARMGGRYAKARYFVDPTEGGRMDSHRVPRATCFAAVYATTAQEPGLFDVVDAGGIMTFAKLGPSAFFRNYRLEQWLAALKQRSAPEPDYLCIEHFFVRPESQGRGLGRSMVEQVCDEALAKRLPILVVVTEPQGVQFYQRQGFSMISDEVFTPAEAASGKQAHRGDVPNGDEPLRGFPVWLMWRGSSMSPNSSTTDFP